MIFTLAKHIARGQSMARVLMNYSLKGYSIHGKVLDIGGSRHPDYFEYLRVIPGTTIVNLDMQQPEHSSEHIDFETDKLRYDSNTIDTALMFNILEHIYNHNFLVGEVHRVMKPGAHVIGFVPFLVNYHPDPHDFFRYTKEALDKIFKKAGFHTIEIKEIGRGPFAVNYNNIVLSVPIPFRLLLLPIAYTLDSIMLMLRPKIGERYPLGYMFEAIK
jgi:SAM-dependent methyltransferase